MASATLVEFPKDATIATEAHLREARIQLEWALRQFREATHAHMRACLATIEGDKRAYLAAMVKSNSSGWMGGPYTDTNLREALTREIHVAQLAHYDAAVLS